MREIPPLHYAVLVGLLNRCSRLMLSNVALSSDGRFGETTQLLDRCILETAIKIQWLCLKNDTESFVQYLADGLKRDLILKEEVEGNIRDRGGKPLIIEQRMLGSINRCVERSGLSKQEIHDTKRLPDLYGMCQNLGLPDGAYTAIQRMGSHAVHGTWTDLLNNYLNSNRAGDFTLRDHNVPTHQTQYVMVTRFILHTIDRFVSSLARDLMYTRHITSLVNEIDMEIVRLNEQSQGKDFDEV